LYASRQPAEISPRASRSKSDPGYPYVFVTDTRDLGVLRRLPNLDGLITKARDANRRLLETIRVGQGCVLASPVIERIDTRLPGTDCNTSQMTYDLRRLRLNGLIHPIEHTHTYVLTPDGQRLAIFYTKHHERLPRPLTAANQHKHAMTGPWSAMDG